ncbi:hypothetical protein [Pantoea sp. M_9]|uniref:hypothetical protein n=1 Tax=Pantoea sp. M_9 TaxID=2608041 RepID=UPI001231ECF3|nr:hypothetical protein [Pantoea sp. M_9]KAA5971369.1 hypothetical protein F3I15_04120 [Pantoea sp. M_9]
MLAASVPCTKEVMPLHHEIIDTVHLNGLRCHIIYNSVAPSASVITMDSAPSENEASCRTLAALELERVAGINTVLRIKSFWSEPDEGLSGIGFVEPSCLATALYNALATKKRITLVGL